MSDFILIKTCGRRNITFTLSVHSTGVASRLSLAKHNETTQMPENVGQDYLQVEKSPL